MRTNVECEVRQIAVTFVARGRRYREDHRGIYTPKPTILEDRITDQLGKPYGGFHRALLLLGNNNPGVVQCWVRDDIGIHRLLSAELDQKVLFVRCRDREHLTVHPLDIAINGILWQALDLPTWLQCLFGCRCRDRKAALRLFRMLAFCVYGEGISRPEAALKWPGDQPFVVESQNDKYEDE